MRFAFLMTCLAPAILTFGCTASHPPDDCDESWMVDFDRRACVDSVDREPDDAEGEPDDDVERNDGGPRRRDGGARDPRARDASFDPELDGDGPCKLGISRKCQCPSGAYSEQSCRPDRTWQECACDGRPPLVFGDASTPARDGGRPGRNDGGAPDAAVERDAHVEPGPPLTHTPALPTVPVPDCRAPAPVAPPARSSRWLAYRAVSKAGTGAALQLVELGEGGPGLPVEAGSIDTLGPLGGWTSDGAHFAFNARATRNEASAVHLASAPAAGASALAVVALTPSAAFDSWAPTRPRLAVRSSDAAAPVVKVFDATAPAVQRAALPVGTAGEDRLYWSPDGRYLALGAVGASGLTFWDLDAPTLAPIVVDTSGRDLVWSSDGKRFAYVRTASSAELWAVAWDGTGQLKQQVSSNVSARRTRLNEARWLDANRLFWQEAGGGLFITDLSGPAPVTTPLGIQPAYYSVSPGGVCIAYSGPCSDSGQPGVCVRKLDPAAMPLPAQVSNLAWGSVAWSQTGDQLALASPAGTLVEALNLDGSPFVPQLVSLGREGQFVAASLAWAPGVPARWLAFHEVGRGAGEKGLSLWSNTQKTKFPLESRGLSFHSFVWSPDGRDLVLHGYYPGGGTAAPPASLLVLRVADGALGAQWIVVGPDLPELDLAGDLFYFQP